MSPAKVRKARYVKTLRKYITEFKNLVIIQVDNVGSNQLQIMRLALRKTGSAMLMGKNTVIRKVLRDMLAEGHTKLDGLVACIEGNMGFVFTNEPDIKSIRNLLTDARIPAAAKPNQLAPVSVTIPKGCTPLDPGNTSFFQALDIGTKITKGSIEILTDVQLIRAGERVSASAVSLLSKLGIKPFFYGIAVPWVYEDGSIYSSAVLDLTEADLIAKFSAGIRRVAALSLATGYPTLASVPHSISNAFKSLVAICVETEYEFEEAKIYKEMLANPDAFKSAAPAAAAGGAATADAPAPEPESESEEEDMEFDLFD